MHGATVAGMTTTRSAPSSLRTGGLLRQALRLDSVVTAANGAAYLLLAQPLAGPLGLSTGLLRGAGGFLLVFAAGVWLVASRPRTAAVEAVVAANLVWSAGSVGAALAGFGSPSTLGATWMVLQAAVVAAFAALQVVGLRRR